MVTKATKDAIWRYSQTEKGKVARRTCHRRNKGIKTTVTRPRVWKFGYCYTPSLDKLVALLPNLEDFDDCYLMCYASGIREKVAECALAAIKDGRIIFKGIVEDVPIETAVGGDLSSGSLAYAIENLIDTFDPLDTEDENALLFMKEYKSMATILLRQEMSSDDIAKLVIEGAA